MRDQGSETQALTKGMKVRRVELRDNLPTDRAGAAAEDRETAQLSHCFSFVPQQVLSKRTRHHICRQGMASKKAIRQHTGPKAANTLRRSVPQRRARNNDKDQEKGKPQRKPRKMTPSTALLGSSSICEGAPSAVGRHCR